MKRIYKVLLIIVCVFVLLHFALAPVVKHYANKILANGVKGYTGHIEDVNLHLYRGGVVIKELVIKKTEANIPAPFLDVRKIDASLAWRALFKGKVVADIDIWGARVNFVQGPSKEESQTGVETEEKEQGWKRTTQKLLPINIERFAVHDSEVHFRNFQKDPPVDLYLNDIDVLAKNLSNVQDKNGSLPSSFDMTASVMKSGRLKITSKLNALVSPYDFDLNFSAKNIPLQELNPFLKAYGGFDAEGGEIELYSEIAAKDGNLSGYVKPFLRDVKIIGKDEKFKNIGEAIKEGGVGLVDLIFRYYPKDEMATKIPIKGSLKDPKFKIWTSVSNILKHAFISQFQPKLDKTVDINDAHDDGDDD